MAGLDARRARDLAVAVAREAAQVARAGWGNVARIDTKRTAKDLVTEWDTRVERLVRERLTAATPGVPVLGEEEAGPVAAAGEGADAAAGRWLVDPIDGTTNFAHGLPLFSVTIAYEHGGRVQAGVVLAPALGWEFAAARGLGATLDGRPLAVSRVDSLGAALLATGFPVDRHLSSRNNFREWERVQRLAGGARRLGSASIDLCLVARGWLDGYWEFKLKPWDLAAGTLCVEEAGGRLTALDGGPFDLASGEVVASNGRVHEELLAALAAA